MYSSELISSYFLLRKFQNKCAPTVELSFCCLLNFDFKKFLTLPISPGWTSTASTMVKLFVVMLCNGPKAKATTVHVKQMTLYGIEKSGVGKFTNRASV